ncbi:MAG: hypothetical protein ABSF24_10130 [Candidatus Bathyarchaeia archaeon]|jgi:hypothetical protein
MPKNSLKEILLFSLGVVLGILGNYWTDCYEAYIYPKGIPQDQALGGTIVLGLFIAMYVVLVIFIVRKD